jgi:carbonic anhydrase
MSELNYKKALRRLKDGNERFVQGVKSIHSLMTHQQREDLANNGQRPFAIVLGCADSRAPAETVFDAGLGELFVVRLAGNIISPVGLGSIEFAAANFGTPLCVVLGHTRCGAIAATVEAVSQKKRAPSDHIQDIVLEIEPSVKLAMSATSSANRTLIEESARLNVIRTMERIMDRSKILSELAEKDAFKVVGGIYNLNSGYVDFIRE